MIAQRKRTDRFYMHNLSVNEGMLVELQTDDDKENNQGDHPEYSLFTLTYRH